MRSLTDSLSLSTGVLGWIPLALFVLVGLGGIALIASAVRRRQEDETASVHRGWRFRALPFMVRTRIIIAVLGAVVLLTGVGFAVAAAQAVTLLVAGGLLIVLAWFGDSVEEILIKFGEAEFSAKRSQQEQARGARDALSIVEGVVESESAARPTGEGESGQAGRFSSLADAASLVESALRRRPSLTGAHRFSEEFGTSWFQSEHGARYIVGWDVTEGVVSYAWRPEGGSVVIADADLHDVVAEISSSAADIVVTLEHYLPKTAGLWVTGVGELGGIVRITGESGRKFEIPVGPGNTDIENRSVIPRTGRDGWLYAVLLERQVAAADGVAEVLRPVAATQVHTGYSRRPAPPAVPRVKDEDEWDPADLPNRGDWGHQG